MQTQEQIAAIKAEIDAKIASLKQRTSNDSIESLQIRLAIAEINEGHAYDQRDWVIEEYRKYKEAHPDV